MKAKSFCHPFLGLAGLSLLISAIGNPAFAHPEDKDDERRAYESIGAIREICTMSRFGIFEQKDESHITQSYPLNSLTEHLSLVNELSPELLDQIINKSLEDPSTCPSIWPKKFKRTKEQLKNCKYNAEDCLGKSMEVSEFKCTDTTTRTYGFLDRAGEARPPITMHRNYIIKVNLKNETAIIIEDGVENHHLSSNQMEDGIIHVQDHGILGSWRLNPADLSINYTDAYISSIDPIHETAESIGSGKCQLMSRP